MKRETFDKAKEIQNGIDKLHSKREDLKLIMECVESIRKSENERRTNTILAKIFELVRTHDIMLQYIYDGAKEQYDDAGIEINVLQVEFEQL